MKFHHAFLNSSAFLLFVTAVLKLLTLFTPSRILLFRDPIIPFLSTKQLLIFAAIVELFLFCIIIFKPKKIGDPAVALLWFSISVLCYRLLLAWSGGLQYCNCLGSLTDWLKLDSHVASKISGVILCYFFVGSLLIYLDNIGIKWKSVWLKFFTSKI